MRRKLLWQAGVCAAIVAGLITLGALIVSRHTAKPTQSTPPPVKNVVTYSTPTPSEHPVTVDTYHSTATGNQPKYIKLPTIHAEGYIEAVGIDQHGAVAVPRNINLAGWYVNTLSPGQEGLSVIDGHINGQNLPGIFEHLAALTIGDTIEVDLADGTTHHFVVKSIVKVPAEQAATALFSRDSSIASQLNLITCGGTFNRTKGAYEDRVIVTTARAAKS